MTNISRSFGALRNLTMKNIVRVQERQTLFNPEYKRSISLRNLYRTHSETKEGWLEFSHLAQELHPKHVIKGKVGWAGKRWRRRKRLLDNRKENKSYWNLKQETLTRTLRRTRFARDYRCLVRRTRKIVPKSVRDCTSLPFEIILCFNVCNTHCNWNCSFCCLCCFKVETMF